MKVLIADDHPLYREAVATQLGRLYPQIDIEQVASVDDILGAVDGADVDLFLIDYHMPGMSLAAIGRLVEAYPRTPIAVVSGTADNSAIRSVIAAGARGFIPKTSSAEQLAAAISMLLAGGTSIPTDVLSAEAPPTEAWVASLSPREMQVLKCMARGISNKEIGRELNLAEVTIKLHLRTIFRKIGARSRAEAAVIATKAGIA